MKLIRRLVAVLFLILVCVAVGNLLIPTSKNALADNGCLIPKPNLESEIPSNPDNASECKSINIGEFAWQTFVALNWPADDQGDPLETQMLGDDPESPRVWEHYEFADEVFKFDERNALQSDNTAPLRFTEFGSQFDSNPRGRVTQLNLNLQENGLDSGARIVSLGFKPLVDRWGNYVLNEVRMNPIEVKQIVSNGWNTIEGLKEFADQSNPFELICSSKAPRGTFPRENSDPNQYDDNVPCLVKDGNDSVGTIEIKAAWMVLSDADPLPSDLPAPTKYYTTKRVLNVKTPQGETTSREVPVALVGFHILRKTSQLGWIWATFEHMDCTGDCSVNTPLAKPDDQGDYLWGSTFPYAVTKDNTGQTPSQITRLIPIQTNAKGLNNKWQTALPSFWKNYQLIGVQWLDHPYRPYNLMQRVVLPAENGRHLANTTLEPYVQKEEGGNSCVVCHTRAALPSPISVPADFSFLMRHAKPFP
jgi:hypothetical protein